MAATSFEDRVARIDQRCPKPEYSPIRFAQSPERVRKQKQLSSPAVGRNLATMAIGAVAGALMGVLVQGAVLPGSPWGPGTQYGALLGLIGLAGLLASLPLALMSVYMRRRRPFFFFFSAAYAISVISIALM